MYMYSSCISFITVYPSKLFFILSSFASIFTFLFLFLFLSHSLSLFSHPLYHILPPNYIHLYIFFGGGIIDFLQSVCDDRTGNNAGSWRIWRSTAPSSGAPSSSGSSPPPGRRSSHPQPTPWVSSAPPPHFHFYPHGLSLFIELHFSCYICPPAAEQVDDHHRGRAIVSIVYRFIFLDFLFSDHKFKFVG